MHVVRLRRALPGISLFFMSLWLASSLMVALRRVTSGRSEHHCVDLGAGQYAAGESDPAVELAVLSFRASDEFLRERN